VLDHLASRILHGDLIVLVGAGASRWAGLPTWKEVACVLAKELAPALRRAVPDAPLRFEPPDPDDELSTEQLVRIGEAFRFVCGEELLVERLRSLFDTSGIDPRSLPLHQLLVRLSRLVPAFYTTNFDDLLERTFVAAARPFQVVSEARDLHEWRYDELGGRFVARFPIYKLHGTLERPHTIVFGESDFQRRSDLAAHPIDLRFASDVVGRELLLLGYSFSDPNVRWLWTKLRDLAVLPPAWFLELGASTDLDVAYFIKDRVTRLDLEATDARRPRELLDFLERLLERCETAVGGRPAPALTPPSPR
jgi:SIR2-like protein